ncbi:alpha/beta hydrolase domain-containing protein [Brevundimonas goettingensis]|uniref:Alpha/beta hydrolase domain-containing protein n=1 Tax=Brevundimonas goettingensis TaxID=2774190 RepID=A0A975C279_9CAUL|nr:alpha/beta hydrolase domain-containing protein [Brevundimonas goettingensis]QTC90217.1 hypothetical protein IFJ75_13110 [Brevundimonas goettingensis]
MSGWQSDLAPSPVQQTLTAPTAHNPDGSSITGPVLARFTDMPEGAASLPVQGGVTGIVTCKRPVPVSLDTSAARLVRRANDDDPGEVVPPSDWAFADCSTDPFPGRADPASLCVKSGFDPRYAYELTYTGKDPLVQGIGFAAVRDINAFFRDAPSTEAAPNPVAGAIKWEVGVGYSQSGNFLRSFINLGFNTAPDGGRVFDGIMPIIAARQVPLNLRFGVPGGTAELYEPGSEGVVWWADHEDRSRGLPRAGLLTRCTAAGDCPKVFDVFGSAEFWGLRKSPDLIGPDAAGDIPAPGNVRRYYLPGVTHSGGAGGFPTDVAALPPVPTCDLPANPNPASWTIRALTRRLTDWVASGTEPPASVSPTLANGDLVAPRAAAMGFPSIPGKPSPDGKSNPLMVYDFGPDFRAVDLSGVVDRQPPALMRMVAVRVPRVDADGNETSGVASVQSRVPLGTYLGWNVRSKGYYGGRGCGFMGGYIPFAATRAEREASGDPRLSLEERYGSTRRSSPAFARPPTRWSRKASCSRRTPRSSSNRPRTAQSFARRRPELSAAVVRVRKPRDGNRGRA